MGAITLIKRLSYSSLLPLVAVSTLTSNISLQSCQPSLFARYNAGRNYRMDSASKRGIFSQGLLLDFKLQNVGWLSQSRPNYSSSSFDDDFAELGSPVKQPPPPLFKLMTEKRERYQGKKKKTDRRKKISLTSPALLGSSAVLNDSSLESVIDPHDFQPLCSITFKNVPFNIRLSQLRRATSVFGKISKASMKSASKRLDCYIEFQSEDSCKKAISAGQVTVCHCELLIYPLYTQSDMSESLLGKENDTLGSLSSELDNCDIKATSEALNNRDTDERKCLASLFHRESTPVEKKTNNEDTTGSLEISSEITDYRLLETSSEITDYKRKLREKRICVEDLENLHQAIIYLEHHPLRNC
ncbi:hypothetical protein ACFE04_017954 [Oxalis oulophora]